MNRNGAIVVATFAVVFFATMGFVDSCAIDRARERERVQTAELRTVRASLATCARAKTAAENESARLMRIVGRGMGEPEVECPNFTMRNRDAQLDAAYDVGFSRASRIYGEQHLDEALQQCTEALMRVRRPEGP